jgi:cysteine-rich repeat protein
MFRRVEPRAATNLVWCWLVTSGLVGFVVAAGCGATGARGGFGGAGGTGGVSDTGGSGVAGGTGGSPKVTLPVCGNGILEEGEACDDGNIDPGDGCGPLCAEESGWSCSTPSAGTTGVSPSTCTATHPSCGGAVPLVCHGTTPDCCGSGMVPGGTFQRDGFPDPLYAASVSDFRLDTYEVTVGRFRAFVDAYPGSKPAPRTGRNPNDYIDPGWDTAWDAQLPADQAALIASLQCDSVYPTWGKGDDLALNCVTWYEALAFCIWDGGRLPTSAEWNYAAAGGAEGRIFPWSSPPSEDHIDAGHAVYSPAEGVAPVGSTSPDGDGKFGQADLSGNLWEWTQDWYAPYDSVCHDCANLIPSVDRVTRGGSWYDDASYQVAASIDTYPPAFPVNYVGFRCARSPRATAAATSSAPK